MESVVEVVEGIESVVTEHVPEPPPMLEHVPWARDLPQPGALLECVSWRACSNDQTLRMPCCKRSR